MPWSYVYQKVSTTKFIAAAVSLVHLTGVAISQQPISTAPQGSVTGADATIVGPGISMGKAATTPLKDVEIKDTDLVASRLV
ncbi:hypothetical protein FHW37_11749 [Neorhizobium alkalisoli]|uniref:Uncharacterized protein n=2 Tax=Neorhizobium alkalisoli TaxID=528178 RepID=A0A561Q0S0_9HYPH|nr:hypothetical protein FHW37_11749 [Neorhizobium alkalisoli]